MVPEVNLSKGFSKYPTTHHPVAGVKLRLTSEVKNFPPAAGWWSYLFLNEVNFSSKIFDHPPLSPARVNCPYLTFATFKITPPDGARFCLSQKRQRFPNEFFQFFQFFWKMFGHIIILFFIFWTGILDIRPHNVQNSRFLSVLLDLNFGLWISIRIFKKVFQFFFGNFQKKKISKKKFKIEKKIMSRNDPKTVLKRFLGHPRGKDLVEKNCENIFFGPNFWVEKPFCIERIWERVQCYVR